MLDLCVWCHVVFIVNVCLVRLVVVGMLMSLQALIPTLTPCHKTTVTYNETVL
jgi:hypothetical protein